jgi:very-short-patch-repair endonuclease
VGELIFMPEGFTSTRGSKVLQMRGQAMRKNLTPAEGMVWKQLSNRKLLGFKFSRQIALGNYIVDFLCKELRIVIEVDGPDHEQKYELDAYRTQELTEMGFTVVRVTNTDVAQNMEGVLAMISDALVAASHPSPLPLKREGE